MALGAAGRLVVGLAVLLGDGLGASLVDGGALGLGAGVVGSTGTGASVVEGAGCARSPGSAEGVTAYARPTVSTSSPAPAAASRPLRRAGMPSSACSAVRRAARPPVGPGASGAAGWNGK